MLDKFLRVYYIRHLNFEFSPVRHFGFEAAALPTPWNFGGAVRSPEFKNIFGNLVQKAKTCYD
jgi:hypothetical protein